MFSKLQNLKKYSFLLPLTLYLLSGCSTAEDESEQKLESIAASTYTLVHNKQKFTAESYETEMCTFLKESQETPLKREVLYREIIHNNLRNKGFSYNQLEYWMFSPPINLGDFEKSLDKLKERKKEIDKAVGEALPDSAELLPGEDKIVHVLPALPEEALAMEAVNFVTGIV